MTVSDIAGRLGLTCLCGNDSREVTGGYTGDLLSWVMGRCSEGDAWITIMSNQNVAAVAVLCGAACVILAENVAPDEELLKKAREKEVALLRGGQDAYTLSAKLHALLGK